MKKQTAVEWLFAHLLPFLDKPDEFKGHYLKCLSESKAMEKEQIEKAVFKGQTSYINSENYYNETYGK